MKVLLTLTDVEPAVRLNAMLEKAGVETVLVSPIDDVPGTIRRQKPDVIVLTGGLLDTSNLTLVKQQMWDGAAVIGLADIHDEVLDERLRALGFVEIYPKPVILEEVLSGIQRVARRRELQRITGLRGESAAIREVIVQIEQMAPVSSTVLVEELVVDVGEADDRRTLPELLLHQGEVRCVEEPAG